MSWKTQKEEKNVYKRVLFGRINKNTYEKKDCCYALSVIDKFIIDILEIRNLIVCFCTEE